MLLTWAPGVLRAAGLTVVEVQGWQSRSHGEFPNSIAGVWHHDGSPQGDSAGSLGWMVSNWADASANFWVDRRGVWHIVAAGVAWHAGKIMDGCPGNYESFGVETDQTINETPPPAMLASVRVGMVALLKHMGRDSSSLWFHKVIARPHGRKVDPWMTPASDDPANWPAELASERQLLQGLAGADLSTIVAPSTPAPVPAPVAPNAGDVLPARLGSRGNITTAVQRLLIFRQLLPAGTDDGIFGPQTQSAVRAFQRLRGLVDDGVVGAVTWAALNAAQAAAPYSGALLRQGSTGADVVRVQRQLGVIADGDFGPRTKAAVVAFQRSKGLGADGIVGPATWRVLFA